MVCLQQNKSCKMKLFKIIGVLWLILSLTSCTINNKKSHGFFDRHAHEYIILPKSNRFISISKDTIVPNLLKAKIKIFIYVDSSGCTGCKLQLDSWEFFMSDAMKASKGEIAFLFYFQSHNIQELEYLLKNEDFDYPVCVDSKNEIEKLNDFHSDCFYLLNKDNKIILEGNPLQTMNMRKKYISKIVQYVNENY